MDVPVATHPRQDGIDPAHDDAFLELLGQCYWDPELFVRSMFCWGAAGSQLAGEDGPDIWQQKVLAEIRRALAEHDEDISGAIRIAVRSGHGVGKTALVAWIVLWFISTRPNPQIVVTANTKNQLDTKTWREVAKWQALMVHGDWFKWSATRLTFIDEPETWFASAIPWSEHNSEAFAGTHEKHVLVVFDEASAIARVIWEVIEGAMTTSGAMWFAFGNPTQVVGRFRECWTRFRKRWRLLTVDSREAKKTHKPQIEEWIADYGIDSDFVRVRVLGLPPRQGPTQFISADVVEAAMAREILPEHVPWTMPRIMGIDIARQGDDDSVILVRHGPKEIYKVKFHVPDLMKVSSIIAEHLERMKPDAAFLDAVGMGAGVYDRLCQLGWEHVVVPCYAGNKSDTLDRKTYFNPRIEWWARMKTWLKTADLIRDDAMQEDLIGPEYYYDTNGLMRLEEKELMKKRGLASPDSADALALTFAQHVAPKDAGAGDGPEHGTEPPME